MFWSFAMVCSAHGGPLPMPVSNSTVDNKPVKILHHSPNDLASLGAISMSLTIINIIVIFIMGVLVLKVSGRFGRTGWQLLILIEQSPTS